MTNQERAVQVWDRACAEYFGCPVSDAVGPTHRKYQKATKVIAAYGKEQFRAVVDKFQEWSDVAFYPGPNENPHFQAGYMEAVHEVGRIAYRLLAEQGEEVSHLKEVCRYCGAVIMECCGSGPTEIRYGVCDRCASGPKKPAEKEKV